MKSFGHCVGMGRAEKRRRSWNEELETEAIRIALERKPLGEHYRKLVAYQLCQAQPTQLRPVSTTGRRHLKPAEHHTDESPAH